MSREFVVPPAAEPGDRVAVVAPASGLAGQFPHVYELGLERIESEFGLEPVAFPTARKSHEYLYDHPEERARDVMDAFRDPDVGAVVATIGGNDQIRVLDHLDADVLGDHPTRFFGMSDNTNLALALWNQGVVSFYGGHLLTEFAMQGAMFEYTVDYLERALFEDSLGELRPSEEFTDEDLAWDDPANLARHRETEPNPGWRWHNADRRVSGRTWGGSLEIVSLQLAVDRFLPDPDTLDGGVLVLETSEELPQVGQVERMVMGLGERGLLERFDGVLVGRAKARSHREEPGPDERSAYRERQREAVVDLVAEYNPDAPVVTDLDFGHTAPTAPIPIGGVVEIDPASERIAFQ